MVSPESSPSFPIEPKHLCLSTGHVEWKILSVSLFLLLLVFGHLVVTFCPGRRTALWLNFRAISWDAKSSGKRRDAGDRLVIFVLFFPHIGVQ